MAHEQTSNAQPPWLQNAGKIFEREKKSNKRTDERTPEKESTTYVNEYGKKAPSEKQPKRLEESRKPLHNKVDIDRESSLHNKQCSDDLELEKMLNSDLHDDELSLGGPLSIRNFFKAVKTFSKRPAKIQKPRLEPEPDSKDTDVVVFERPTTPRANLLPRVSRSLPPVLDFHELFGPHTDADDQGEGDVDNSKQESFTHSKTDETKSNTTKSLWRVETQPSGVLRSGIRLHRCPGPLREVESEPDGLQEFGSFDLSTAGRDGRKSRRSSLNIQLEDLGALHF